MLLRDAAELGNDVGLHVRAVETLRRVLLQVVQLRLSAANRSFSETGAGRWNRQVKLVRTAAHGGKANEIVVEHRVAGARGRAAQHR